MSQELNDDERWLLEQIKAGLPASFAMKTVIKPTVLRDHILGLASEDHNSRRARGPWILHNAEFREPFDLSDGRQASGGSLPAIEFVKCRFHAGFCADGADLDRLAFRRCAFVAAEKLEPPTSSRANPPEQSDPPGDASPIAGKHCFHRRAIRNRISLRNCRIRTELRLESLFPKGCEGKLGILVVDGFSAVIGTNVVVTNTLLRTPQGDASTNDPETPYALDLSTAKIGGDVRLTPRVKLLGGLNMRDARVGGTFTGAGLRLSDGETPKTRDAIWQSGNSPHPALRLDTATIEGSVIFGTDESRLLRKVIRFQSREEMRSTLAKVELRSFIEPFLFRIGGKANLRNLTVNGDLDISQCTVDGPLQMQGLTVRGDMTAYEDIDDEIKRILPLDPRENKKFPLKVDGSVWLNNARIDGDVILDAVIKESLYVSGAEFNGFVELAGSLHKFIGVEMRTAQDFSLAFKEMLEIKMPGASVGGTFILSQAEFSKGARLNLKDCEVHQAIEFAVAAPTPKSVNTHQLSCYSDVALTEVLFKGRERSSIVAFLTFNRRSDEPNAILLDGRSKQLNTLDKRLPSLLKLETQDQAREYLKLFCAYVWGEEGSGSIITNAEDLGTSLPPEPPDPEILKISLVKTTNDEGKPVWKATAYERRSDGKFNPTFLIFIATFLIFKDTGNVETTNYKLFGRYKDQDGERPSKFSSPYRTIPFPNDDKTKRIPYWSDFSGRTWFQSKKDDLERFKRETSWKTMLEQIFTDMHIFLNGASCRFLGDNAAWWKDIRFLGIEYFNYKAASNMEDSGMDEIKMRLDMIRKSLGLEPPETDPRSFVYLLLTILFASVLLIVIFIILYNAYATPLTSALSLVLLIFIVEIVRRRPRQPSGFRTEPYTHLAQVLNERGDVEAARKVEAEKIWQVAVDRGKLSMKGRLWKILWWRPYRVMFGYGLLPGRAFLSVAFILALGTFAVSELSYYHMLEAAVTKVAPSAQVRHGQEPMIALQVPPPGMTADLPCGENEIQAGLYAFELLTPILNLHQESRCGLRSYPGAKIPTFFNQQWPSLAFLTERWFWEYAKALYMLVGSVISSLAILTFSGIARRWEQ